ncbi:MAG: response regulator [Rhodocyclaceae bacterium]|nr:response regulator [Rhodocyclaceae bacterium]MBK6907764.1 response regulator [Rhodocyclaceae bacterium]
MDDEVLVLSDDPAEAELGSPWKILVVDDDADVHATTGFALQGYVFMGRKVSLSSAYSGREALEMFNGHELEFDLALIDVVMETPTDGIDTAKAIRKHLECVQVPYIILRSGQPAYARADDLLAMPEINAYLNKAKLSVELLQQAISQGLAITATARDADGNRTRSE